MENWKRFLNEEVSPDEDLDAYLKDLHDTEQDEEAMFEIERVARLAKIAAEVESAGSQDARTSLLEIEKTRRAYRNDPKFLKRYKESKPERHQQLEQMKAAGEKAYREAMTSNMGNWEDLAFLQEE